MRKQITRDGNRFTASARSIDLADLMTIEDVAEQMGCSISAIRWLLRNSPAIGRQFKPKTSRYYSREDLRRIRMMQP